MVIKTTITTQNTIGQIRIKCTCGNLFTTHNIYKNYIDIVICLHCGNQFSTQLVNIEDIYNNGRKLIVTHHTLVTRNFFIKPHNPRQDKPDYHDIGEQLCPGDHIILNRKDYCVHQVILAYYGNDVVEHLQEIVLSPILSGGQ